MLVCISYHYTLWKYFTLLSDSLLHHTGGPCLYIIDFISKVDNESWMSSKKLIGYPPRALKSSMYQRNRQDLDKSSKIFHKKCTLLFSFNLCNIVTLLHIFWGCYTMMNCLLLLSNCRWRDVSLLWHVLCFLRKWPVF